MGDRGTLEDLCIAGEKIKMRDINFILQNHSGSLQERASSVGGERFTSSNNSSECNGSKDLHMQKPNLVNFTKASEVYSELDGLRQRKRKQENINIHRVSSKLTHSSQDKVGKAQEGLLEAVELEQGILKVCDAAIGALQVCDSSQDLKRCKMKSQGSRIRESVFDTNTTTTCALNDKLGLDLDIEVSGTANNVREERFTSTCKEAVGTKITASALLRKGPGSLLNSVLKNSAEMVSAATTQSPHGFGLLSPHKDYENRGKVVANVKEVTSMDQTENQRLRAALAVLQSQFNVISTLVEKGSRNCGHCQSIKEELRKLSFNCGDISSGQVSAGKVAPCVRSSPCEEAQECSSPVGSCTSEKTAARNENCKRHSSSILHTQQMEPMRQDTVRNDSHEDIEEAECHLCIELASSQSEDQDTEQGGSLETQQNASIKCLLPTERESKSENLHIISEENKNCAPDVSMHEGISSQIGKGADNFHEGGEDEGECGGFSDKNSKEEGCWNSGLTRNSWGSQGGEAINEADDEGYIDLKCGCSSQKYGDTVGILRLFQSGKVEIQCQCSLGCIKGKPMSPANFERHSGRGASKKWKETIWIVLGDRRVQFSKVKGLDAFVRRYKEPSRGRLHQPAPAKLPYHRDEFMQCKKCFKRRRFRRKTKEDCRLFHEASMNTEWECSNYPFESVLSCQDDEEREARQANRGCMRYRTCQGCIQCVCLGCFTCRFEDCSCRLCREYIVNNK